MKRKKYSLSRIVFLTILLSVLVYVMLRCFASILFSIFLIIWAYTIVTWICASRKGKLVEANISTEVTITRGSSRGFTHYTYSVKYRHPRKTNVEGVKSFFFKKNAERFVKRQHALVYYLYFNKKELLILKEGLVRNILLNCFLVIPILIYLIVILFPSTLDTISGIVGIFG